MKIGKRNCKLNCRITNWEVKGQEKQMAQMVMISRYRMSKALSNYAQLNITFVFQEMLDAEESHSDLK